LIRAETSQKKKQWCWPKKETFEWNEGEARERGSYGKMKSETAAEWTRGEKIFDQRGASRETSREKSHLLLYKKWPRGFEVCGKIR